MTGRAYSLLLMLAISLGAWIPPAPGSDLVVARGQSVPPADARDPAYWPFDKLSPWNRPLGANALYQPIQSALTGAGFTGAGLNYKAWTVAYWIASPSDPMRRIFYDRWDGPRPPAVLMRRIPDDAVPSPETTGRPDRDMLVISPDHTTVLELYRATRLADGHFQAANAYEVDLRGMGDRGIVTCGMSLAGGNIRAGELRYGIRHALAFTTSRAMWNRFGPGGRAYVWPARRADGVPQEGYGSTGNLFMGSRVAIPPSVEIEALGLETPEGRVLARALQDYGAIGCTSGGSGANIVFRHDYAAYKAGELHDLESRWEAFQRDLRRLARELQIVANSHNQGRAPTLLAVEGIGGGKPRAPLAPDFRRTP